MNIIDTYKNLLNYSRKAKRAEYILVNWGGIFILFFILFVLASQGFSEESLSIFSLILVLLFIPVTITTSIARCHDIGWSGWYLLLQFIPLVNIYIGIALLFFPSKNTNL